MFPVSDVIPSRTRPVVTVGLIVINALVFLYELQLDRPELFALAHSFGVVPADFAWTGSLTGAFLHDGWIHFGGNMLYLWIFGDNVEDSLGHWGFAAFYLAAAVLSAAAHAALNPSSVAPLIGASGAVAAVMGAYFVLYPRSQVLTAIFLILYLDVIEVPAVLFLGVWLVMQLLAGLFSMGAGAADGGLAIGAHLAGFAVGIAAGVILRQRQKRREWRDDAVAP
jgi:membrane associated rhomboid family serine protease